MKVDKRKKIEKSLQNMKKKKNWESWKESLDVKTNLEDDKKISKDGVWNSSLKAQADFWYDDKK